MANKSRMGTVITGNPVELFAIEVLCYPNSHIYQLFLVLILLYLLKLINIYRKSTQPSWCSLPEKLLRNSMMAVENSS